MKRISIFLPVKKNSERVSGKNTRKFAGYSMGLFERKILQLINVVGAYEIVVSTNDEKIMEYCSRFTNVRVDWRPQHLCLDSTKAEEVMIHAGLVCKGDYILLTHCTSPFTDEKTYTHAIDRFNELDNDSLIGVMPVRNFFMSDAGEPINWNGSVWPRTQDLAPLLEVNHAIFIAERELFRTTGNKIGKTPYLYRMTKLQSMDIDWEEDFMMAEGILKQMRG
jgi:CMP-N-acetylneuraminic acid synthetase